MKIISKHNKKDFYDYSGFGHDTSDDILFVRMPKTEELGKHDKIRDYFNNRIPYTDSWHIKNYFITYVIVGIYPYCYIIPTVINNYENLLTQGQVIVPFEVADTNEEVNTLYPKVEGVVASTYIVLSEEQPSKARFPMLVTLLGMVMVVKEEQTLKALIPMLVTLLGIVIEVSEEQPLKA